MAKKKKPEETPKLEDLLSQYSLKQVDDALNQILLKKIKEANLDLIVEKRLEKFMSNEKNMEEVFTNTLADDYFSDTLEDELHDRSKLQQLVKTFIKKNPDKIYNFVENIILIKLDKMKGNESINEIVEDHLTESFDEKIRHTKFDFSMTPIKTTIKVEGKN